MYITTSVLYYLKFVTCVLFLIITLYFTSVYLNICNFYVKFENFMWKLKMHLQHFSVMEEEKTSNGKVKVEATNIWPRSGNQQIDKGWYGKEIVEENKVIS